MKLILIWVGFILLFSLTNCEIVIEEEPEEKVKVEDILADITGTWSTGVKQIAFAEGSIVPRPPYVVGDTIGTVLNFSVNDDRFESYLSVEIEEGIWQLLFGYVGSISLHGNGTILVIKTEETYDPAIGWHNSDFTSEQELRLRNGEMTLISEGSGDNKIEFANGAIIDFYEDDVETPLLKQSEALTVTGTIYINPTLTPPTEETLNLSLAKGNLFEPMYERTISIPQSVTTSQIEFKMTGVKPGNYMLGAFIDVDSDGEYRAGDYGGSCGNINFDTRELNIPIFENNTDFDIYIWMKC